MWAEIDVQHVVVDVSLGICVYIISLVVYRLHFHPLSKFPGPRWAAITDYWELYQDYYRGESGQLFVELDYLHDKFGPIVRVRPNEVHVKDSEWMSVLYSGPGEVRNRDPFISDALGVPKSTIGTVDHNLHRIRRAAISPLFTNRAILKMEPALQEHADLLVRDLKGRRGEIIDIRVYFFAWTTEFFTSHIFQSRTNLFWNAGPAWEWYNVMIEFTRKFALVKHFPWLVSTGMALPLVFWQVFVPSLASVISVHKNLRNMAEKASIKHNQQNDNLDSKQNDDSDKDVFQTILTSDLPPKEKHPERIANEVYNLLVAGSLSTSKTVTIGVYHILANPSTHEKLKKELAAAIPVANEMLSINELKKLPFLTAVIQEILRISSIVSSRSPLVSPEKALEFQGSLIPPGSSISMTYCKAALDAAIFPDPHAFEPDRWLAQRQRPHDFERYVLPFGRGSRVCVGLNLAYAQIYLLLATIFRRCDLELFETVRERDVDIKGGGPLGEPSSRTKGVRVSVKECGGV